MNSQFSIIYVLTNSLSEMFHFLDQIISACTRYTTLIPFDEKWKREKKYVYLNNKDLKSEWWVCNKYLPIAPYLKRHVKTKALMNWEIILLRWKIIPKSVWWNNKLSEWNVSCSRLNIPCKDKLYNTNIYHQYNVWIKDLQKPCKMTENIYSGKSWHRNCGQICLTQ